MGQRQSSPQPPEEQSNNNSRERVIRPSSRTIVERMNPIQERTPNIQHVPINDSQRREERRQRRAARREQQEREEENVGSETQVNARRQLSPFARMLAHVISEAVVTSLRSGQISLNQTTDRNTRQHITMHLSPELFQQMEPESDENSFMRFMRLPVIVSNVPNATEEVQAENQPSTVQVEIHSPPHSQEESSAAESGSQEEVNRVQTDRVQTQEESAQVETDRAQTQENQQGNDVAQASGVEANVESQPSNTNEGEATRILMLPVFLYGIRNNHPSGMDTFFNENSGEQPQRRQSQRIRERLLREENHQGTEEPSERTSGQPGGQWTVYIISGNSIENIMSEHNPTYEELLDLASIVGPARRPTVSQEAIDNHVPIVKYTQQVKLSIIGNAEGCQVCLNSYQSEEDVRILACHHGFHKDCIDKWLTEGQNQCPLCRNVPVPTGNQ